MKDGRVFSQGSVSQVLAKDRSLAIQIKEEQQELEKADEKIETLDPPPPEDRKSDGKLIVAEEIALGHISWPASMFLAILLTILR